MGMVVLRGLSRVIPLGTEDGDDRLKRFIPYVGFQISFFFTALTVYKYGVEYLSKVIPRYL